MAYRFLIFMAFPVAFDLLNCYLELRRNRRGTGMSGVPLIIPLIAIFIFISAGGLHLYEKLILILLVVISHITLVFIIPYIDARIMERRRK